MYGEKSKSSEPASFIAIVWTGYVVGAVLVGYWWRCINPFAVFVDKIDEAINSFYLWYIEFHGLFTHVEVDFSRGATDVTEIGIGHFAWAIHNASHNGDTDAFEVTGCLTNLLGGFLEIKKSATAGWTGDVVSFENS